MRRDAAQACFIFAREIKKHKDMKNTDYTPAQQMDSLVSSQSSLDALKELIDDLDLQVVKVTRS